MSDKVINKSKEIKEEPIKKEGKTKKAIIVKTIVILIVLTIIALIIAWPTSFFLHKKEVLKVEFTETSTKIKSDSQRKRIIKKQKTPIKYNSYKELKVDQTDTSSGYRQPKVKVDVGFDTPYATRDYWSYTNKHSQLVYVHADKIILQNDKEEADYETSDGRFLPGQVAAPEGVGQHYENHYDGYDVSGSYIRGHVIADSLGGSSIAYNVTPQDDYLNGSATFGDDDHGGMQVDVEDEIRNYGGAEYFSAEIEYSKKDSNIPDKYHMSYIVGDTYKEYTYSNLDARWVPKN